MEATWILGAMVLQILCGGSTVYTHEMDEDNPSLMYKAPRYLLYGVNLGEGFNLRRDVYMRMAVLTANLNKDSETPWVLVLPAWGHVYHWKSRDLNQERIPWSNFFDVDSLRKFVPVIEFEEFLKITPSREVDEVYYLQRYKEGWDKWEEKMDKRECIENYYYHYNDDEDKWYGWFFGFEDVWTKHFECVSIMGHANSLKPFLTQNTTGRSVMIDRAETVMHDRFGDAAFWKARRSMRFAKHLRDIGDKFRQKHLDSSDEADLTVLPGDWTQAKKKAGEASGGPYLAVHLRRADFVKVRAKDIPSLESAGKQINELMEKLNLQKIFIATDAPKSEFEELKSYLDKYEVFRYRPSKETKAKYKDGGVAIIDQWICAHARYFIGSRESTFSFRIQDEREILGFDPKTTFNRLCNENDKECEQPAQWKIVY